jgi:hypothetical protein
MSAKEVKRMSLEQKLRQIAAQHEMGPPNWPQRKEQFRDALKQLYALIEEWLGEYRSQGLLNIYRYDKGIFEEYLGEYDVECLEISIGEITIVLEPVGTHIIGAYGRVDVFPRGYKDDAQLLLLLQHQDGLVHWELWKSKDRGARQELSKGVFERLLDDWL